MRVIRIWRLYLGLVIWVMDNKLMFQALGVGITKFCYICASRIWFLFNNLNFLKQIIWN